MSNRMSVKDYKKNVIKEKEEQEICLEILFQIGIKAWRNNTGMTRYQNKDGTYRFVRFGLKGSPDIIGFMPGGKAFFWEVKRKKGYIRPEQHSFIDTAKLYGCVAGIGTSDDLREMLKDLNLIK